MEDDVNKPHPHRGSPRSAFTKYSRICEQYQKCGRKHGYSRTRNHVISGVYIHSCYAPPSSTIAQHEEILNSLMLDDRSPEIPTISTIGL